MMTSQTVHYEAMFHSKPNQRGERGDPSAHVLSVTTCVQRKTEEKGNLKHSQGISDSAADS
uniref:Uncharacterized protein n=1 Tax=Onchocerca volvulus TaxID=6282 RepID=A0A8R1TT20_ONCVO